MRATTPLAAPEAGSTAHQRRRDRSRCTSSRKHSGNAGARRASEPGRLSVAARIGRGDVAVVGAHDDLPGAEIHVGIGDRFDLVPERDEPGAQFRRRASPRDRSRCRRSAFQRGASSAACGFMPWISRRTSVCTWPGGWIGPPITPNAASGAPSLREKARDDRVERPLAAGDLVRMARPRARSRRRDSAG